MKFDVVAFISSILSLTLQSCNPHCKISKPLLPDLECSAAIPDRLSCRERLAMPYNAVHTNTIHLSTLTWQEAAADTEHLSADSCRETINLSGVLLDLPAHKERLKSAGLSRELEELLPLVLVKRRLLACCACGVLGFAL